MNKYAVILLEDFKIEDLNGVAYPVCMDMGKWKMLEYTTEADPPGNWMVFSGENANSECSKYLSEHE